MSRAREKRIRYFLRRRAAIVFLGSRCALCGEPTDTYTTCTGFEFDHIDPLEKDRTGTRYMNSTTYGIGRFRDYNAERFWAEIEKCQLLCTECHEARETSHPQATSVDERVPF